MVDLHYVRHKMDNNTATLGLTSKLLTFASTAVLTYAGILCPSMTMLAMVVLNFCCCVVFMQSVEHVRFRLIPSSHIV